jgi:hypothetical protein
MILAPLDMADLKFGCLFPAQPATGRIRFRSRGGRYLGTTGDGVARPFPNVES